MVPSLLIMVREGFEAALIVSLVFAYLRRIGRMDMAASTWLGIGVAIAVGLGLLVYLGGRRLPMRAFFQVTGVVVIVFAAGLLARTVLFLQQSGDLGTLNDAVYNLTRYRVLTQRTEAGKFLAA